MDAGEVAELGETGQVVFDYLQKGNLSTLEQEWPDLATAPGNEKLKIRRARLAPLGPYSADVISVETAIEIEFEFWVYEPGNLHFTLHILTIEGTYVFCASSKSKPRQRGGLKQIAKIPANFLNDGLYTVTIQVVQDLSDSIYFHPEILVFEVLDSVREGNWFGKWPGVVRPKLEWISENIGEGSDHE